MSQVIACGIVAAGMQNHNGVFFQTAEALKHGREVDAVVFFVIVRILADFETSLFKNCNVVLPCRCADNGFRIFENSCKEVCADFKSTGTAERLNGNGMLFFDDRRIGTENQLLNAGVKSRNTGDRKISMRLAGFKDSLLASATTRRRGTLPSSVLYTPILRLTFLSRGSDLKASLRPRMGSSGACPTTSKWIWT